MAGRVLYPVALAVHSENLTLDLLGWRTAHGMRLHRPLLLSMQFTPALAQCGPPPWLQRLDPNMCVSYAGCDNADVHKPAQHSAQLPHGRAGLRWVSHMPACPHHHLCGYLLLNPRPYLSI